MLSFAHTDCLYLIKKIEIFVQIKIALFYLDVYIKM